jgi:hypothetical protein
MAKAAKWIMVGAGLLAVSVVLSRLLGPGDSSGWPAGPEGSADTWPPVPVKQAGDERMGA